MPVIPFRISERASRLVSHSHTLSSCSLIIHVFLLQTILLNSSFVPHHVSTYNSWLLSWPTPPTSLSIQSIFFSSSSSDFIQTTRLSYSTDKSSTSSEQSSPSYLGYIHLTRTFKIIKFLKRNILQRQG